MRRFLDSYARHSAGVEHRLLVLYNGFTEGQDLGPWDSELEGVAHESLRLGKPVLDLDAYRDVAERVPAERYCFLNSYSVVQADGWLGFLEGALAKPGVGIAGATGSWASRASHMRFGLHLGGPYAQLLGDPGANARLFRALGGGAGPHRAFASRTRTALDVPRTLAGFPAFPAHHLRTNGLIVERDVWMSARTGALRRKLDVHLLESGRRSLTRQVEAMGLRVVVVGRDADAYEHPDWARSRTFSQGEQENLLIADNQTEAYMGADAAVRVALSRYAWGAAAESASAMVPA